MSRVGRAGKVHYLDRMRLFVYGTLMQDGCRHEVLSGQLFLGPARTQPLYALLDLGAYPGLVSVPSGGVAVEGEVYQIADEIIPLLDQIEGAPELYQLGRVFLEGIEEPVYAYFYRRHPLNVARYPASRWDSRRSTGGEE
jgi:gamma-glutamylcyclotransferase (GGCT)/AIG2-like uncharacterized protein YtfP